MCVCVFICERGGASMQIVENSNLLTKCKMCAYVDSFFNSFLTPKSVVQGCLHLLWFEIVAEYNKTELSMNLIIYSSLFVAFN